jgi:glycosyltransferase involved in cell wall biosynthesis
MKTVSVLIPSRLQRIAGDLSNGYFLQRAIRSVFRQTAVASSAVRLQIIVGIDVDATPVTGAAELAQVEFARSGGRSQAEALNAAAERIHGDFVAVLEDDDEWMPPFLEVALAAAEKCAFVSSNQMEMAGAAERIADYPTPSGWVMPVQTWTAVGKFNEEYRWHVDSEWLGRLNERAVVRVHLVEAGAPLPSETARRSLMDLLPGRARAKRARRGLLRVIEATEHVRIVRHEHERPLVVRHRHVGSGMELIKRADELASASRAEKERLRARFGSPPW